MRIEIKWQRRKSGKINIFCQIDCGINFIQKGKYTEPMNKKKTLKKTNGEKKMMRKTAK